MANSGVSYSITKVSDNGDGTSTYRMTYKYDDLQRSLVQRSRLVVSKEDADGTKSTSSVELNPFSLASFSSADITEPTASRTNGFTVNLSDSNLAVGGTYYEIDSFSGTYSGAENSETGGSEFEGEMGYIPAPSHSEDL